MTMITTTTTITKTMGFVCHQFCHCYFIWISQCVIAMMEFSVFFSFRPSSWAQQQQLFNRYKISRLWLRNIAKAVSVFDFMLYMTHMNAGDQKQFFDEFLPSIIRIASDIEAIIAHPIPLLHQGQNQTISLSQLQTLAILSNAFLCTFPAAYVTLGHMHKSQ